MKTSDEACGTSDFRINNQVVSSFELNAKALGELVPSTGEDYEKEVKQGLEYAKSNNKGVESDDENLPIGWVGKAATVAGAGVTGVQAVGGSVVTAMEGVAFLNTSVTIGGTAIGIGAVGTAGTAAGVILAAAGVGALLYDATDYEHSLELRNSGLTFEAKHINEDAHFYMLDVSVSVPPGGDAILSVNQSYRWNAGDIGMTSPPPINSTRKYDVYIPANDTDVSEKKDLNLPVFGKPGDFNELLNEGKNSDEDEKSVPETFEKVQTDVLAGFTMNARVFDRRLWNNNSPGGKDTLVCTPTQSVIGTESKTTESCPWLHNEPAAG